MKTRNSRIKCTDYGLKPEPAKAGAFVALGIGSVIGAGVIFYMLVQAFMVFTVTDISPYIYYSIGFGVLMFLALVSFYYYDRYNG